MRKKGLIFTLGIVLGLMACQPKSEYQKLKETELATGVVHDTLFAGISFSMTKKDFFDYCWKMNKEGIFMNGTGSQVLYEVTEDFSRPTNLTFYPKYVDGKMLEMPMEFQYQDWALWNEETKNERLIEEVMEVMLDWYGGNDFFEVKNEDESISVWVKIDGNRQIRVGRKSISSALVTITDLRLLEEIERNKKS